MKYCVMSEEKKSAILTLRFGSTIKGSITKKHLGYASISRIVNVPQSTVRVLCVKHETESPSDLMQ